jgi:TM2 domain-containing membrane protein YozV
MALISCPECSTKVSDRAASCPSCGYPIAQPASSPVWSSELPSGPEASGVTTVAVSKSRGIHIILGLIFGGVGFHNFYSGHYLRGGIKVGLFLVAFFIDALTGFYSAFSIVLLVLFTLWALVEVIVVKDDAAGNAMS